MTPASIAIPSFLNIGDGPLMVHDVHLSPRFVQKTWIRRLMYP